MRCAFVILRYMKLCNCIHAMFALLPFFLNVTNQLLYRLQSLLHLLCSNCICSEWHYCCYVFQQEFLKCFPITIAWYQEAATRKNKICQEIKSLMFCFDLLRVTYQIAQSFGGYVNRKVDEHLKIKFVVC